MGTTSEATVPATPSPEPVSLKTSTTCATPFKASPAWRSSAPGSRSSRGGVGARRASGAKMSTAGGRPGHSTEHSLTVVELGGARDCCEIGAERPSRGCVLRSPKLGEWRDRLPTLHEVLTLPGSPRCQGRPDRGCRARILLPLCLGGLPVFLAPRCMARWRAMCALEVTNDLILDGE
jgi:hypothetical protein